MPFLHSIIFAIHRDNYGDKSVSENDAIFCNPMHWIAKNGIVFPILKELNWRPAAASGNIGMQKMASFSLTGKFRAPPRRAATFSPGRCPARKRVISPPTLGPNLYFSVYARTF